MSKKIIYAEDAIDALKSLEFRQYMEFGEYVGEDTKEVCLIRAEKAQDALQSLPSAQPEQRWIPTSEKLPEYDKPVLLSTAWGKTEIGFWTQRGWMIVACSYREFEQDAVTAWMPLPEPYKEGE